MGAAAVTLAGELLVAVAGCVVLRQMQLMPSPRPLAVPALAALCMIAVLAVTPDRWPVAAHILAGGAVYIAVVMAARTQGEP